MVFSIKYISIGKEIFERGQQNMKKFNAPTLTVVDGYALEPVYACSGTETTDKTEEKTDGDWDVTCEWRNHNTGHHSELAIKGKHHGDCSGNTLKMDMVCNGFKLDSIKDNGGYPVSNVCESGFTITRNNFYNATDQFEFNIQLTCEDSPYQGSVTKTGSTTSCKVICSSYTGA